VNVDALRKIAASGVDIGSHTHTHRRLTNLSDAALREETTGSRKTLEDILGHRVRFFSFPFGGHDERVRGAVRDAGYEAAVTTRRAIAEYAPGPFEIPRKGVGFGPGPAALLWKILKPGRRPG
jgi:peptidoglycan/xylan/chitin deacetylase (PgdA/CDA1 family)